MNPKIGLQCLKVGDFVLRHCDGMILCDIADKRVDLSLKKDDVALIVSTGANRLHFVLLSDGVLFGYYCGETLDKYWKVM